ncbi:MAG TPA: tryptophan 2,3-dioxygenase family protein [Chitinophagales bacterium]|nr:tryptophan 2,3-dioxygenase family protein [Chitinophagales bacterium]
MASSKMYYSDYLQLNKILHAQTPESGKRKTSAHDEMLFIITHQAYELWFKQIIHELNSVREIFRNPINDNSPAMQIAVHRLKRIVTILGIAVEQINVMETMTPLDFLDFRDLLRPASGFQSIQFKIIEALMGLKMKDRHAGNYYISQLRKEDMQKIMLAEKEKSLLDAINAWLERMPFFRVKEFWPDYKPVTGNDLKNHVFWKEYRKVYQQSLLKEEWDNINAFDEVFFSRNSDNVRKFSAKACRSALFIMLYRDYPLLQLPFQLLNTLLDIDEMLATWRYRHMNMVHRMIGMRVGTGGSSGKEYLRGALEKHYIFGEIADLSTFLIERRRLPKLSTVLEKHLSFV